MSDVAIKYKGSTIAEMSASGSKTLQTQGKYCEENIAVEYTKPAPSGTKQITLTENGTVTEDVTNYASAEITVDVQGGGGESQNQVPNFYVYLNDNGTYRDISGSRVTNEEVEALLKNGNSLSKNTVTSIWGHSVLILPNTVLAFLFTAGVGGNSNLISEGNKVNAYGALHLGFSSEPNLNAKSDYALHGLIPTTFTATGQTPNYMSVCKGHTVSQITITVSNPDDTDFVVNSLYISCLAVNGVAIQVRDDVTGNEHCS